MLNVAVITDGHYGDRTYDNVKKEFETVFIQLEKPLSMFMEDIKIPADKIKKMEDADILITYTLHPDLTLELVERFSDKVNWIIVAAWQGEGFKNQLESYGNVICPAIMCELEENGDPILDDFLAHIGKPKIRLRLEGNKIGDIEVIRTSPCGSTSFLVEYLREKYQEKEVKLDELPLEAGLKIQHYPCRAAKIRIFSDEECQRVKASELHKEALEEAIKWARNR
jgi:hypothetical protein